MEKDEKNLLLKTLESLQTLKKVELNLEETELDDGTLEKLGSVLSRFEFLEDITLKISGNSISLDTLENVLRKIEKLPSLTNLTLRARRIKAISLRADRMERIKSDLKIASKQITF